ncbi:MAG TPA: hypothetical protein VFG68_04795 [Fimbriiglobus sp.]|nr:hypothetical protein [Fimbriiglobus sp.]
MPRIRLLGIALAFPLALGCVVLLTAHGICADPLAGKKGPPKPLAEMAKDLRDPDRDKRLLAVEAIQKHYKDKSLEVLPQLIEALGDELDRPEPVYVQGSRAHMLKGALWDAVQATGSGRVKVAKQSTRHTSSRVRAAGYWVWGSAALDQNVRVDRNELLTAIRRGMKDESPLVRSQAVWALHGIRGAPPAVIDEVVKLAVAALDDWVQPCEGRWDGSCPAVSAAGVLTAFGAKAKPAFGALVKATEKHRDTNFTFYLCTALAQVANGDPTLSEEAVKVFRAVFNDKQRPASVRESAIRRLIGMGAAARWAIPDLVDFLEHPKTSVDIRLAAIAALTSMGPRAAPAVPVLIDRLEKTTVEWEQLSFAPLRKRPWMIQSLGIHFGPWFDYEANVIRPLHAEQSQILHALKAIGPAAAHAAKRLERWMENHLDEIMQKQAYETLVVIEK